MNRLAHPFWGSMWRIGLVVLIGQVCWSADQPGQVVVVDPAQTDRDFAVQGEYLGTIAGKPFGLQVIALGNHTFDAVVYRNGLPGQAEVERSASLTSKWVDEQYVFEGEGLTGHWSAGLIHLSNQDGAGTFVKVQRTSPTAGLTPPKEAVVLFDGSSADAFQNGRLSPDGLLMQGVTSKQKFDKFFLHLEFRTPYMPTARNQGRGNSGCYLQGRYEVQILDSFGLAGKNNEAGGIYGIADPRVNMCFPPLSWQTYDIDFTPAKFDEAGQKVEDARMTVWHNGVLVQNDVRLPKVTTAALVGDITPEPGPVYLQDHGNPLRFRNIWLLPTK